jgi:cell wall-associated NlpC family hydrolase
MRYLVSTLFIAILICSFCFRQNNQSKIINDNPVVTNPIASADTKAKTPIKDVITVDPALGFAEYAKTLVGTPYVYGSVNPRIGLGCSGFVNYVSNDFGIKVPGSSGGFTNVGTTVETDHAKPGDLILFAGTDAGKHMAGHMGIITFNHDGQLQFIHSSSGEAKAVTITELSDYYRSRLVKIVRIFPVASDKIVS